jgi:protease I
VGLGGRLVAIFAEDLFEDAELLYPFYRMMEAGAEVLVVGTGSAGSYHGKHGLPIAVDVEAGDVDAGTLAAAIVPGGYAPDRLRRYPEVLGLVKQVFDAGKPVALICHAPWVGISARIVRGRRMTSASAIKDDVVNAGAEWVDEEVVVDGNLISSRGPADLPAFCRAIITALEGQP